MNVNFYNQFHKDKNIQHKTIKENNITYRSLLQSINNSINDKKRRRILDYGCGVGTVSFYLAEKGNYVTGVDISEDAVGFAIENAQVLGLSRNTNFITLKDFYKENNKYDLVICSEVIEHVNNDKKLLLLLNKNLKKNGDLILSTPSDNAPFYRLGLTKSFDKRVGHLRRYNPDELVRMIEKHGFAVNHIRKIEGVLRNSLYIFPILGNLVRFIKGPISDVFTSVDNVFVSLIGESNIIIEAKKV